ncbi:MAG: putative dehydrogenase [Frankiales bacterium]|jgi:NAD(P)-dependent dehydrogenase (short-subunit alcohol dehydrogenase family)|nr:putative dehydrogenase [Frankiales bacterium]
MRDSVSRLDPNGAVVVITGAGGGLGAELSRQLTARGARIALLVLPGDAVPDLPGSRAWEVDVTDAQALTRVAAEVQQHFGRIDVVVVNAGIGHSGAMLAMDPAAYERVIEVNLLGSVRTVRAFLPALVESRGHVLQIASLAAMVHAPLMSAYAASKAGVEAMAHALRPELAHLGVTVGVAYLAFTDTAMVQAADTDPALKALRASLPGPFGKTYPVVPAVARIVAGIERRSPHVYAQAWLRVMAAVRGQAPGVVARQSAGPAAVAQAAQQASRPRV